jgi:predicted NAD/FAD-dependent oxidoreductase
MRLRRDASIAVLGAGVSGLCFAAAMRERGFARVVVFERETRVGGKSCTLPIAGRAHDLGATMGVPIDYRDVLRHSRRAGIETARFPEERHYSLSRGGAQAPRRWRELPAVLAQTLRYLSLHLASWRGVDGNGLHQASDQLQRPWAELAARHHLGALSRRTLAYRAGYGYGFDDEVPALMYANLFRPATLLGLALQPAFIWNGGTQPIWQSLARTLDVRLGSAVERVERDATGVTVHTGAGSQRFDALVVTVSPTDALRVLDASDDERRWFSQVRCYPYATFACEVRSFDAGRAAVGYIDENMVRERAGHPMAWVKRYADQDICVFHLFAPPHLTDEECLSRIAADVARLGGRVEKLHAARRWQFFPHFTCEALAAGVLGDIERWQGRTRTWLIGEALSFATMARVAEHAIGLAERLS